MSIDKTSDWNSVQGLISDWYKEVSLNQDSHSQAAKLYNRLHYWLGVPVVIFSTVVGTAAFASLHQQANDEVRMGAGIVSVVSAILASLQTFFGFGERAEKHRALGVGYEKARKEINEIQKLPIHLRGNVKERLDRLRQTMDALGDGSPDVPAYVHRRARAKKPRHETTATT